MPWIKASKLTRNTLRPPRYKHWPHFNVPPLGNILDFLFSRLVNRQVSRTRCFVVLFILSNRTLPWHLQTDHTVSVLHSVRGSSNTPDCCVGVLMNNRQKQLVTINPLEIRVNNNQIIQFLLHTKHATSPSRDANSWRCSWRERFVYNRRLLWTSYDRYTARGPTLTFFWGGGGRGREQRKSRCVTKPKGNIQFQVSIKHNNICFQI
jgi:hypothetical protein